ncbi:ABC-three component system protein [Succinivibrio dextrinosolvens]|uniref:ABC-three component system protein n=1 Tax=Succinivibrio dextrinosolvens TaxID=83771 RepID=UPI001924515D|nr:ABC-three component system protein [Succinivibrio dextrinosolvens]
MVTHEATASMIGYLYQIRYALYILLQAKDPSEKISLEKFDDISIESDKSTPLQIIQTKCHTERKGDLSDRSTDLWRTLKVWIDAISNDSSLLDQTKFVIITTANIPNNSAASFFSSDPDKAYALLKNVALGQGNESHAKFYAAFLSCKETDIKRLISRIEVISNASGIQNILDDIKQIIRYSCRPNHIDFVMDRVEGWWFNRVISALLSDDLVIMSQSELSSKIYAISREYDADNLPLDCFDVVSENAELKLDEKVFVEQLKLLNSGKRILNLAIKDYLKASSQRSSWIRQGLVYANDLEKYEDKLMDAWEHAFALMGEKLDEYISPSDEEKIKEGKDLYRRVSDYDLRIRDNCDAPFIMHGTYHIMANDLKVGWHIDYFDRLKHLLNVESNDA